MHRFLLPIVLLLGCPSEEPSPEPTPEPVVDLTERLSTGQARAGVISEEVADAVVFAGIASEGRAGDVLLYNDRVRFVLQGARMGNGYVNTGGGIIDADLVRPDGQVGRDVVEDVFLAFGIGWLFHPESMEIVDDGSGGGAVVRAVGRALQWEFIAGVGESPDPIVPDPGVLVTREYELLPDAWSMSIRTRFENDGDAEVRFNPSDGWMAAREDVQTWATGEGLDPGPMDQGAVGESGRHGEYAMAMWRPDGAMDALSISGMLSGSGILVFGGGWTDLAPGAVLETERTFAVAPDTNHIEATRRDQQGVAQNEFGGRVLDPDGTPVAGARVHFVDGEAVDSYALTDADGAWTASLPAGDWTAVAVGTGGEEQVPLPVGAGRYGPFVLPAAQQRALDSLSGGAVPLLWAKGRASLPGVPVGASVDVPIGASGRVAVTLRDDDGLALPGYVEFRARDDRNVDVGVPPAAVGLPTDRNTILGWFAGEGTEFAVPPGSWDVHLEASFRHERVLVEEVEVPSGGALELEQTLEQRIPFDGWIAVDSHLHAAPSGDGDLPMEDRLIACAVTGIQIPVTTDHDAAADYQPLGAALGLHPFSRSMNGLEVSPVVRGHFNMFPFEPDPTEPHNGAEPWWDYPETTDELMARMHARRPDAIVQVNHGRSGMFSLSNYIRETGQGAQPYRFSWDFDVFELAASQQDELILDFFSFLDHGQLRPPMGVSDSHGRTSTCGKGRTDVYVGEHDPQTVTDAAIRDAILAGHVVVSRGVTVRATSGDSLPGDVVTGGEIAVTVQALPWMKPSQVRLWRNGEVVETRDVSDVADGATWFDEAFAMEADTDSWFVVEVFGGPSIGGVWRGTGPWAMTNAFLYDADGDGWQAPGP